MHPTESFPHLSDFFLPGVRLILVLAALALAYLPLVSFYRSYLGLSGGRRVLLYLATLLMSLGTLWWYGNRPLQFDESRRPMHTVIAIALLWVFLLPFLIRLYQKWIGGAVTEQERSPDMNGVRAWLRGGNLVCALAISLLAAHGLDYSFWAIFGLTLAALVAYPVLNMFAASSAAGVRHQPRPEDDLSDERERVLRMLEAGRITAEESADLLNALGQTVPPRDRPPVTGPGRKLVLAGAALVLLGFFLPWLTVNLGDEMNRMGNEMRQTLTDPTGRHWSIPPLPQLTPAGGTTIRASGGDIRNGLGWLVLILGAGTALLPFVINGVDPELRWKIGLLALGTGGVLLAYILTQNLRHASIGLIVVMAGYALEILGMLKERPASLPYGGAPVREGPNPA